MNCDIKHFTLFIELVLHVLDVQYRGYFLTDVLPLDYLAPFEYVCE